VTVLIPRSAVSRRELTYAKLLCRVHPDRMMGHAFEGIYLKPGTRVGISALRPSDDYPETPLLLEFAGSDHTGRGHHRSNQIYILWRFRRGEWVEVVRTLSKGAEWIHTIRAVALREIGGPPPPDPALAAGVVERFLGQIDRELGELAAADRGIALSLFFEQMAARLCSAGELPDGVRQLDRPGNELVGEH
jgi:hypothetical protein